MGEMADESAAELVDRAIENVMAFKRVALLLDDLSPDREAADRLVRAFEEERAAPWLTAHLLGCIGHEAGYATVRQILVSAPGMSAEGYAGVALAKIRGDDAFDELVALMGGAVDRRSREGAAYGLGQLGSARPVEALLGAARSGHIRWDTAASVVAQLPVEGRDVVALLQSEEDDEVLGGADVIFFRTAEGDLALPWSPEDEPALRAALGSVLARADLPLSPVKRERLSGWVRA